MSEGASLNVQHPTYRRHLAQSGKSPTAELHHYTETQSSFSWSSKCKSKAEINNYLSGSHSFFLTLVSFYLWLVSSREHKGPWLPLGLKPAGHLHCTTTGCVLLTLTLIFPLSFLTLPYFQWALLGLLNAQGFAGCRAVEPDPALAWETAAPKRLLVPADPWSMRILLCILFQPKWPSIYCRMRLVLPVCRRAVVTLIRAEKTLWNQTEQVKPDCWFPVLLGFCVALALRLAKDNQSNYYVLTLGNKFIFISRRVREEPCGKAYLLQWAACIEEMLAHFSSLLCKNHSCSAPQASSQK